MDIFNSNTPWKHRAIYFPGKLDGRVLIKIWQFRDEIEYDEGVNSEITAMTWIQRFVDCIGFPCKLITSSDIAMKSASRSKKGALWDYPTLRRLPNLCSEIECGHNYSRLIAVVDLAEFGFDSDPSAVLNWGRGLIVLSFCSLEHAMLLARDWASNDKKSIIAFDYDSIAERLQQGPEYGILRYLPPGNSLRETIVIVGNENFLSDTVTRCIESIV